MAETLKERKDIEAQYLWDLTPIYASDEAWEKAFAETEKIAEQFAAYPGTLGQSAERLREFYDLMYGAFDTLGKLHGYAFQRKSEDNRQDTAQSMYSRAYSRYVQLMSAVSFAEEGDAVLLSPASASFDSFPNFEVRGERFKEIVNGL